MSIHVNEEHKLFHLQTAKTSYIFKILENGNAGQLYYGPQIPVKKDYPNLASREEHDCTNTLTVDQSDFQLELIKQEYAGLGKLPIQTVHELQNLNIQVMKLQMARNDLRTCRQHSTIRVMIHKL